MIPVELYENERSLELRPCNFQEFCKEINRLFGLDNADKFTYEYISNDDQYYPLNVHNYPNFYLNKNVKKIFAYSKADEAYTFNCQEEKENIYKEKENDIPDFYEDNIDNNDKIINNINNINNINSDIVKQNIVNAQKEKIKQQRILMAEKEKERILNEQRQKNLENNKQINNIKNEKLNQNNISNQLNDIINENFDKLKNELINESSEQLSKIVMESKIKNREKDEDIDDNEESLNSVEKHGIPCDGCGNEIIGIRYKCVFCDTFDYCEQCEEEKGYVHEHPFYKIRFKIN